MMTATIPILESDVINSIIESGIGRETRQEDLRKYGGHQHTFGRLLILIDTRASIAKKFKLMRIRIASSIAQSVVSCFCRRTTRTLDRRLAACAAASAFHPRLYCEHIRARRFPAFRCGFPHRLRRAPACLAATITAGSLASSPEMWVDEGTGKTISDGAVVECVSDSNGSDKVNAMWRGSDFPEGVTRGEHYWTLNVLAGDGVWFGLTTEGKFGAGWKCKGVMYGCNTSNGGGLVHQQFGQPVKEGDVLGVYVQFQQDPARTVSVRFFHNKRPLGEAFKFLQPVPTPLFPVVGFSKGGEKASIAKAQPPVELERASQSFVAPEGYYCLKGCTGPDGAALGFPAGATMQVMRRGDSYQLSIKAGNTLNAVVQPDAAAGRGGWKGGPVMSTMMFVRETAELQQFLTSVLGETLDGFEFSETSVTAKSPSGIASFQRQAPPVPEPCTEDFLS